MITFPRSLARQFRAVLRRSLLPVTARGPLPPVRFRAGPEGLVLAAVQGDSAVVYQVPGGQNTETLVLPGRVLADLEGRDGSPVALEAVAPGQGRARWTDGGVPQTCDFESPEPESLPALPDLPPKLAPLPPTFLAALAEATQTAARDGVRFAISHLQLRGSKGEVVATDGRQLLVQSGFALPWADDVLIPAVSVFASKDLPGDGPLGLGRTASHVTLRVGPWTFHLPIDSTGRFPRVDEAVPTSTRTASRLHLDEADARFLVQALPRLPGKEDPFAPITLDLGDPVNIHAKAGGEGGTTQLVLSRSRASGRPVRLILNRGYLLRAVKLGFREVQVVDPERPLLCRDATRSYVVMPLGKGEALPPDADVARIVSGAAPGPAPTPVTTPPQRRRPAMPTPTPPTNGQPPRNSAAANPPPEPDQSLADPLVEAEAVRALLQEAHARLGRLLAVLKVQRRQGRALRAAMDSLRQLQLDR